MLLEPLDEVDRVERWRLEELCEAGYPAAIAYRLAREHSVDLHQAIELVEQGCPPELAARILL